MLHCFAAIFSFCSVQAVCYEVHFIFTLHGSDLDGSVTEMELKLTSVLYS